MKRLRGAILAVLVVVPAIITTLSAPASAATAIETMPLWRVQVRIKTASTDDGKTTGTPAVRLNPTQAGVWWLYTPPTHLTQGRVYTYDLRPLATPAEITMLRIGVDGDNKWCLEKVELLLNNRPAFADSTPRCVGAGGINIDYSWPTLRNSSAWRNYGAPPPLPSGLNAADLQAIVTDVTGAALRARPNVEWDALRPLTVRRKSPTSVTVSFGAWGPPDDPRDDWLHKITYDVQMYVGPDGKLHALKTNASGNDFRTGDAVAAHLNIALSRMTDVPAPHPPLYFNVGALANIAWSYVPPIEGHLVTAQSSSCACESG